MRGRQTLGGGCDRAMERGWDARVELGRTMCGLRGVAAEQLVAAVPRERDGDVSARQAGEEYGGKRGGGGGGVVGEARPPRQELARRRGGQHHPPRVRGPAGRGRGGRRPP